jgi:hypothetical protein
VDGAVDLALTALRSSHAGVRQIVAAQIVRPVIHGQWTRWWCCSTTLAGSCGRLPRSGSSCRAILERSSRLLDAAGVRLMPLGAFSPR